MPPGADPEKIAAVCTKGVITVTIPKKPEAQPKKIAVKIGDPVDLSAFRGRNLDAATLNEATTVIMDSITALLADLRGENPPAERWNPAEHDQKETGRFEG